MSGDLELLSEDPRIRRIVWKRLGVKSAREIAQETGLTPEEVLVIKNQMIEEIDVLSVQQMRAKLISDLQDMARRLQDDYDKASYEFKAGIMNSAIAAMKVVLVELNRASAKDEAAVDALNSMRVRELLRLMDRVVVMSVDDIAAKHSIDADELLGVFNGKLIEAAKEIDDDGLG